MKKMSGIALAAAGLIVFAAACESSGAGGRKVEITQKDDGCTPKSVAVTPGEKLNLVVKNESTNDAYEVEGIDGTKLEEFVVHKGSTRSAGYSVPDGAGTHNVKCYVPAGTSTIIELVAGGVSSAGSPGAAPSAAGASPAASDTAEAGGEAGASVAVSLGDYTMTTDKTSVAAGQIRFIATNASKDQVHELAVLKTKDDGAFDNIGEIEAIDPEHGGSVVLDLKPGVYQLACLIAIGESGSTVDHYQQGMHTVFTVR
jgi:plastocyanin